MSEAALPPDDSQIRAIAALLGLPLDEAHLPGIQRFLAIAAQMAATLEATPLAEDALELAPVYRLPAAPHGVVGYGQYQGAAQHGG